MNRRFPVVTLCGSMRFWDQMLVAAREYSRAGWIVLAPFVAFTPEEQVTDAAKQMLDIMHFAKIDMSDAILVVNIDKYIGESTTKEIKYARSVGKRIIYLVNQED